VPAAIQFLESLDDTGTVSTMSITELLAGKACRDPIHRSKILTFLGEFHTNECTTTESIIAGDIIRQHQLSIPDALIAASAIAHGMRIATRDRRAYTRIPGLHVLIPF